MTDLEKHMGFLNIYWEISVMYWYGKEINILIE